MREGVKNAKIWFLGPLSPCKEQNGSNFIFKSEIPKQEQHFFFKYFFLSLSNLELENLKLFFSINFGSISSCQESDSLFQIRDHIFWIGISIFETTNSKLHYSGNFFKKFHGDGTFSREPPFFTIFHPKNSHFWSKNLLFFQYNYLQRDHRYYESELGSNSSTFPIFYDFPLKWPIEAILETPNSISDNVWA